MWLCSRRRKWTMGLHLGTRSIYNIHTATSIIVPIYQRKLPIGYLILGLEIERGYKVLYNKRERELLSFKKQMKLKKAYIVTTISDWNDFFLFDQKFMSRYIFRGQANSDWKLQTSLETINWQSLSISFSWLGTPISIRKRNDWRISMEISYVRKVYHPPKERTHWVAFYYATLWMPDENVGFHALLFANILNIRIINKDWGEVGAYKANLHLRFL